MSVTVSRVVLAAVWSAAAAVLVFSLGDLPYFFAQNGVDAATGEGDNLAEVILMLQRFNGNLPVLAGVVTGILALGSMTIAGALLGLAGTAVKTVRALLVVRQSRRLEHV